MNEHRRLVDVDGAVDVVVVGYGPVGAVAAGLLGRAGLRTAVFESTTSVYHLPRAAHLDAEIMRVLDELGVGAEVRHACAPVKGMHFVNAEGRALLRFDVEPGQGWMFYQPDLERALRAGVAGDDHVEVHLAHEVIALEQHADHVDVRVRDLNTGTDRVVAARYVIGADGGRSIVRKQAGFGVEDLRFDQPWLVVDTLLTSDVELPELVQQICDPARPTTFIPMCGARRRWEFMLLPGESASVMETPSRVAELLAPWVAPQDVEIVRAVVYTFHALLATQWRDRRVFIAGDAAHQMPPFLGQGMCSGIRDVHNLVWKLALVERGLAPDALLDTYQVERSPHVRSIIETAVALGGVLQTTDAALAAERDAAMLQADAPAPPRADMPGLTAGVITSGGGGRSATGDGFELRVHRPATLPDAVSSWWTAIGGRIVVGSDTGGDADTDLDADTAAATIVRPDRYVFGSGDDAIALLDELRSMLSSPRTAPAHSLASI